MEEVHQETILRASVNVQCVHLKSRCGEKNMLKQKVNPSIQAVTYIKLHGRANF